MDEFQKEVAKISYVDLIDPKNISIQSMWKVYVGACLINKTFEKEQYQELQTAFSVGFIEAFKLLTDIAGDMKEEDACALFSNIAREANRIADIKLKLAGVR